MAMLASSNNSNSNSNNSSNRVEAASQTIDELTDAFLGDDLDVDDFLAAIESQVDKMETEPSPRVLTGVDQAVAIARESAAVLIKGVTAVAKESAELADTLPTIKMGRHEDSVTYGEAFGKLGKGAKGLFALASAFGGFVKDTVEHEIEEIQERRVMNLKAKLPKEDIVKATAVAALMEVPNESLTEEEMSLEEVTIPKGINPSLLSSFLQQRRKETENNIVDTEEEYPDEECPAGEPNFLAFFLNEAIKN